MDYWDVQNPTEKFYHHNKFKYLKLKPDEDGDLKVEKKKKHNKLSYCNTCKFLRPPRSFHCSQCGVCVEVHDHHCPWVGNCIGYRNLKYFIAFLFWTGMLALVTVAIVGYVMFTCTDQFNDDNNIALSAIAKAVFTYAAIIALSLLSFFLFQTCSLGMKNIASNEDIRHRWNGHHRNNKAIRAFKKGAGCCGRLGYLWCGNVEKYHGPSKLKAYTEIVQTYRELKTLKKGQEGSDLEDESESALLSQESHRSMVQALQQKFDDLYFQLSNLRILSDQYGIEIPELELDHLNMDKDLLDRYLQQKAMVK